MGTCGTKSAEDRRQDAMDKKIQREQNQQLRKQEDIIKLLLLGAGESGKSTVFKQMKILYGQPWDMDELASLKPVVYANIVQNFRLVLEFSFGEKLDFGDKAGLAEMVAALPDEAEVTPELGKKLMELWETDAVKTAWARKSEYQVLDCLAYYLKDLARIATLDYLPTQQDILQARVRTSGIVEEKYVIDGVQFVMFDVGGQRNERKKWIHAFDSVTAVIFVAAISEYDQVLYEDSSTSRIDEAVKLFDEICNSSWFSKTSMILFLNKNDLFLEKLKTIPLRVEGKRFDNFLGPYAEQPGVNWDEAVAAAHAFMTELFISRKRDSSREIYTHITEATNTNNVNVVFNACKDIILRKNLMSSGFMD